MSPPFIGWLVEKEGVWSAIFNLWIIGAVTLDSPTVERQVISKDLLEGQQSPFVKWPGGKTGELQKIRAALPDDRPERYLEPFLGGGSVLLSVDDSIPARANDICPELINLFEGGGTAGSQLHEELLSLGQAWEEFHSIVDRFVEISRGVMSGEVTDPMAASLLELATRPIFATLQDLHAEFVVRLHADIPKKLARIRKLEQKHQRELPTDEFVANLEGSVRSTFYMAIRSRYNKSRLAGKFDAKRDADFFFLREFSYASMFRFNSRNEFNVPYGGISYNRKSFLSKVRHLFSEDLRKRLLNTEFTKLDFGDFFIKAEPTSSDFVFVDPPYDTEFSDYDGRPFFGKDQMRLASLLESLPSKVMIVIGNSPLIRDLYPESRWNLQNDDMLYKWTIKERNQRAAQHLTITNY